MNYTGAYKSTSVEVEDTTAVEQLFEQYHLDGQYDLEGDELVMFSTATTFSVWDRGMGEDQTTEFLEELAQYLADGEELLIRSVGFTGARHIPDAFQFVISDGSVETEQLSQPAEL